MPTAAQTTRNLVFGLAQLAAIVWLDYITGYEISVVPLYAIPIGWATCSLNVRWGLLFSLLSAAGWGWVNFTGESAPSHPWVFWERFGMTLLILALIALSISRFRRTLSVEQHKVRQLEGILPICMVCHRISDQNGHWCDLDDYLNRHTAAEMERRICPQCSGAQALTDYSQ